VSQSNFGSVKFFNTAKGFGFIVSNRGEDIFFHVSGCSGIGENDLQPDTQVSYDVETDNNGRKKAVNVRKAN